MTNKMENTAQILRLEYFLYKELNLNLHENVPEKRDYSIEENFILSVKVSNSCLRELIKKYFSEINGTVKFKHPGHENHPNFSYEIAKERGVGTVINYPILKQNKVRVEISCFLHFG